MDKYSVYVIVVYAVTFALLLGYLVWLWMRLKAVKHEAGEVPK